MTQQEKDRLVNEYCGNNMERLKQLCYPIMIKIGGISPKDYDDLYSLSQFLFLECLDKYNENNQKGCSFHTFFQGILNKRLFSTYIRDRNRRKRSNIKENEDGETIFIPDLSLDEPAEDGVDLLERIADDSDIDDGISENLQNYLDSLTNIEREIAELIMRGYSLSEIREKLEISEKKYTRILKNMGSLKKRIIMKQTDYVEEEKTMNENCTQTLEKSKPDRLSIASIIKKINHYTIRFDHPLQRESEQWSPAMKGNLISDILQGNPIPPLVFAEQIVNGIAIIWNLDGKQRCTNIYSFKNDGYKISKNIRRPYISYQATIKDEAGRPILDENGFPQSERRELDIRNKKFSELPEELQDSFMDYNFEIVQYLNCKAEDIAYHIARYNEGKPMNTQQKGIICLGEQFASMVKSISAMPFFKEMGNYTVKECSNGTINRVVVESIMAANFLEEWKKDQSEMCEFIKDNASAEMFDSFEDMVERISKAADDNFLENFNSKDSFLWFGLFAGFIKTGLDDKRFFEFMAEFSRSLHSKKVNGESFDDLCIDKETGKARSTKDKYIVIPKIKKLTYLMNEYFGIRTEDSEGTKETILDFVKENVSEEIDGEDIAIYDDMLSDCVKVDSPLYQSCTKALIALMAFACKEEKDKEFEQWIKRYEKNKLNFSSSQKLNFTNMKNDFDKYLKGLAA